MRSRPALAAPAWFGHQHFELEPDIICLAKGLGGGFPMGAIAYTEQVQAVLSRHARQNLRRLPAGLRGRGWRPGIPVESG